MKGKMGRQMDKHAMVIRAEKNMDELIEKWMETVTNTMFKMILFLGIPYFLYVFWEFLTL